MQRRTHLETKGCGRLGALAASSALLLPLAARADDVPTQPFVVGFDAISAGDTAWMLVATAFVLLMTLPGLALFYAGMVRRQNVLSVCLHTLACCASVTLIWAVIGYSLAFTPGGTPYIGGLQRALLHDLVYLKESARLSVSHLAPSIPEPVFLMFQLSFAIITPALIIGAFAERMRFGAMLAFLSLWSLLVYVPVAHWVWEPSGWLAGLGALDFAGGTVVHVNAGAAGLACAWMLGPRRGYGQEAFVPFNLGFTMTGAALLWVGWFGFNAGSALAADGRAAMAMVVTHVAAATAALSWMAVEWMAKGRVTLLGACSGVVAGLVAITPASGFVGVGAAMGIGLLAGIGCFWGATQLKRVLGVDDALDVFGIHGIGGLIGALLTGVFNDPHMSGLKADMLTQAIAAFATLAFSFAMSVVLLKLVDLAIGLRVSEEAEDTGLDLALHGEQVA
ncbi:ammonium transporter [Derxia gummosa]|uniref:Ammonium transporter n=1 Tax=Derxia gummosa DSM 723 TaxID=1121388 RepID=A0A8B6X901_9BURK|nr:ammonium transporter [Derxia gummosa]